MKLDLNKAKQGAGGSIAVENVQASASGAVLLPEMVDDIMTAPARDVKLIDPADAPASGPPATLEELQATFAWLDIHRAPHTPQRAFGLLDTMQDSIIPFDATLKQRAPIIRVRGELLAAFAVRARRAALGDV